MSVEIVEAKSKEMEKNRKVVGFATGGVMFGEGMEKTNWKLVRLICNFGYSFMPKEKGVSIRKVMLGNIRACLKNGHRLYYFNKIVIAPM